MWKQLLSPTPTLLLDFKNPWNFTSNRTMVGVRHTSKQECFLNFCVFFKGLSDKLLKACFCWVLVSLFHCCCFFLPMWLAWRPPVRKTASPFWYVVRTAASVCQTSWSSSRRVASTGTWQLLLLVVVISCDQYFNICAYMSCMYILMMINYGKKKMSGW